MDRQAQNRDMRDKEPMEMHMSTNPSFTAARLPYRTNAPKPQQKRSTTSYVE
jgi:hypothetical protein